MSNGYKPIEDYHTEYDAMQVSKNGLGGKDSFDPFKADTLHKPTGEVYQHTQITPPAKVFVPPSRDYENDLRRFVDAMKFKLDKNAHKGKWDGVDLKEALRLLRLEVAELEDAIAGGNTVEILLEAADIANFAMIAASVAIDKGK